MKWRFYLGIALFCLKHHKSKAKGQISLLQENPWLLSVINERLTSQAWTRFPFNTNSDPIVGP